MTDIAKTLVERGSRYGVFTGHAQITQDLKRTVRLHLVDRDKKLSDDQQEALDMFDPELRRALYFSQAGDIFANAVDGAPSNVVPVMTIKKGRKGKGLGTDADQAAHQEKVLAEHDAAGPVH